MSASHFNDDTARDIDTISFTGFSHYSHLRFFLIFNRKVSDNDYIITSAQFEEATTNTRRLVEEELYMQEAQKISEVDAQKEAGYEVRMEKSNLQCPELYYRTRCRSLY